MFYFRTLSTHCRTSVKNWLEAIFYHYLPVCYHFSSVANHLRTINMSIIVHCGARIPMYWLFAHYNFLRLNVTIIPQTGLLVPVFIWFCLLSAAICHSVYPWLFLSWLGPYMLLEYCEQGTLRDWVSKIGNQELSAETHDQLMEFCMHIARGMEHLGNNKVMSILFETCIYDSTL